MEAERKDELYQTARKWTLDAGKQIRDKIDEPLEIDTKSSAKDLVTQVDKDTEVFFAEKIRNKYPDHKILSEEGFGDELDSLDGIVWIIDPIDGTMNFVNQKRNFAISVAVYVDGIGEIGLIYDVMEDILYHSVRGQGAYKDEKRLSAMEGSVKLNHSLLLINAFWACENRLLEEKPIQALIKEVRGSRSYGSAALELAYLAEGVADSYVTMKLAPWDFAAGLIMLEEVGGQVTQADGSPVNMLGNSSLIAGNPSVNERIRTEFIMFK